MSRALKNSDHACPDRTNRIEESLADAFPEPRSLSSLLYRGDAASNRESSGRKALGMEIRAFRRGLGSGAASGKTLCGTTASRLHSWKLSHGFRWNKLLWNLPYNPVSVLGGGSYRRMTARGAAEALTRALMEEVRLSRGGRANSRNAGGPECGIHPATSLRINQYRWI